MLLGRESVQSSKEHVIMTVGLGLRHSPNIRAERINTTVSVALQFSVGWCSPACGHGFRVPIPARAVDLGGGP